MRRIAILPTLCTLANAVCGFAALLCAARNSIATDLPRQPTDVAAFLSGLLVFLAMIFDVLDGYLARRSKTASQFGAELDSLCDIVSFGVVPAFLLIQLGAGSEFRVSRDMYFVAAVLYLCCAALRLARFNVQTSLDVKSHRTFQGLPSPAAAGCIAALVVWRHNVSDLKWLPESFFTPIILTFGPLAAVILSLLMVSRLPYFHLANRVLHRRQHFGRVVQFLLILVLVFLFRELALVLLFWGYACAGPLRYAWLRYGVRTPVPIELVEETT